jgi:hypothetical protein
LTLKGRLEKQTSGGRIGTSAKCHSELLRRAVQSSHAVKHERC